MKLIRSSLWLSTMKGDVSSGACVITTTTKPGPYDRKFTPQASHEDSVLPQEKRDNIKLRDVIIICGFNNENKNVKKSSIFLKWLEPQHCGEKPIMTV
ncbi:hypothetical protein KQX54_011157 [Cotesia glomerata]|uniref:Uncharacterized protein n=1 Tax=Cotesia glomerata TaxID=32391 RepID=A0AAV7I5M3_COTGL|nr:hypothetical protein KQX54_011157 [Cotesia glomerata]